jgi:hypothetical protein
MGGEPHRRVARSATPARSGKKGAPVLIYFEKQMVNPLAQLAILGAQRGNLPA